jgi:hypothetical protein
LGLKENIHVLKVFHIHNYQHKMHHCNWESLAKLKIQGGWGIRNIFKFNTTLAANSLWRVLTTKGIWIMVIKDNYLPYTFVASWLRSTSTHPRVAS